MDSTIGSPMDHLVHVLHQPSLKRPTNISSRVRTIVVQGLADMRNTLLQHKYAEVGRTFSQLRPDAVPFVPTLAGETEIDVQLAGNNRADGLSSNKYESLLVENMADVSEDIEEGEEVPMTLVVDDPAEEEYVPEQDREVIASEAEISASSLIQRAFRRYQLRRNRTLKGRESIFHDYLLEAEKLEWPRRYYRMLFLGPIPHALYCVNGIREHIQADKDKTKKKLQHTQHQELEDSMNRLKNIKWATIDRADCFVLNVPLFSRPVLQRAERLRKLLAPTSDLHRERDLERLEEAIRELRALVDKQPEDWRDLREDAYLAYKGIVLKRQIEHLKKPKPSLTVDPEDLYQ